MDFVELSVDEYRGVKFASNNFLQAPEMFLRYRALERPAYLVGVKNERGQIVAAGLILGRNWHLGKKCYRVAGGWLMDYDDPKHKEILEVLTEGAKKFCQERGGIMLTVMPKLVREVSEVQDGVPSEGKSYLGIQKEFEELGYKYLGEFEQLKWIYELYLGERKPEDVLASFRQGCRRQIKKAQQLGVRVRDLEPEEFGVMKQICAETGVRQGFHDPDELYYQSMREHFGERVKFLVAEIPAEKLPEAERVEAAKVTKDGYVPMVAAMFVRDETEMGYLYGGSVKKCQKYGGADLMQWLMIQEAIKQGYKHYNFYGTKPIEGNGVYMFKRGFRGHIEELVGTFALPIGLIGRLYVAHLKPLKFREIN